MGIESLNKHYLEVRVTQREGRNALTTHRAGQSMQPAIHVANEPYLTDK